MSAYSFYRDSKRGKWAARTNRERLPTSRRAPRISCPGAEADMASCSRALQVLVPQPSTSCTAIRGWVCSTMVYAQMRLYVVLDISPKPEDGGRERTCPRNYRGSWSAGRRYRLIGAGERLVILSHFCFFGYRHIASLRLALVLRPN